jgi:type 1 glutamine amidotransferase
MASSPVMKRLLTRLASTLAIALALEAPGHGEPGHAFPPLTTTEQQAIRAAMPPRARARPAMPRRVLIFYRTEGYVHSSIPYANQALKGLGEITGAYWADISEDLGVFSQAALAPYDAIVFNNTTHLSLSPGERAALLAFVNAGKGVVGIHAASDSFYTWPEGQSLLGGIFNSHPWTADDTVAVKLDDRESPLTEAFAGRGFWVKDEIYQIDGPYSRERVHVLLSLDMSRPENSRKPDQLVRDDNDFPVAWIKHEGAGRVFYSSLGHNPEIYRTPQILQHYLDGIQFAIGDLPANATPSGQLKESPALAPQTPSLVIDESSAAPQT